MKPGIRFVKSVYTQRVRSTPTPKNPEMVTRTALGRLAPVLSQATRAASSPLARSARPVQSRWASGSSEPQQVR